MGGYPAVVPGMVDGTPDGLLFFHPLRAVVDLKAGRIRRAGSAGDAERGLVDARVARRKVARFLGHAERERDCP